MKDIDFDELDKAVNSLMGGMKDTPDLTKPKTLSIATTLKNNELPAYDNIQQAARKIGSETLLGPTEYTTVIPPSNPDDAELTVLTLSPDAAAPKDHSTPIPAPVLPIETIAVPAPAHVEEDDKSVETTPELPAVQAVSTPAPEPIPQPAPAVAPPVAVPAAKRSSGRFMDVMHASSDMKTASSPSVPPAIVVPSRTPQSVPQSIQAEPIPEPTPAPTPESTPIPEPQAQEPIIAPIEAPAMADVATAEPTISDVSGAVSHEAELEFEELLAKHTDTPTPQEPLVSPFLPDAKEKVEKRPLGGAIAADPQVDELQLDEKSSDVKDAQLTPKSVEPELPAEYHTDLLAIETGSLLESTSENFAEPEDLVPSAPAQPAASTTAPASAVVAPASEAPVVQASEQATPAETGAIFDTNDYHKPVAHPAKSKSGWLIVIIVLVIVLICAGGATAFYLINA